MKRVLAETIGEWLKGVAKEAVREAVVAAAEAGGEQAGEMVAEEVRMRLKGDDFGDNDHEATLEIKDD